MRVLRRTTGVLGEVCVTLGALLLLFVVWQLWWTDVTAGREQAATVQSLEQRFTHASQAAPTRVGAGADPTVGPGTGRPAGAGPAPEHLVAPKVGEPFAIVRIPRFGADYARPILQGTGTDVLQRGVGHYVGTAMPGQRGNFAIAGHRTTYARPFWSIDTLRPGDPVVVETPQRYYVYRVVRHVIVSPDDVGVIAPVPEHPGTRPTRRWLTMTSCHPRYSAAQRYVVFSRLDETYPRAQGLPRSALTPATGKDA